MPVRQLLAAPADGGGFPAKPRCSAVMTLAVALVVAGFTSGCSTFNRDWQKAAATPAPTNSIEGRWEGTWTSDVNGHTGQLLCLLTQENEGHYHARFRATYSKVFRFSYTVPLAVQEHYGGWEFNGEENLGKLAGGVYFYEGHASPTNFYSTYRSKYDHGIFEMRRPE